MVAKKHGSEIGEDQDRIANLQIEFKSFKSSVKGEARSALEPGLSTRIFLGPIFVLINSSIRAIGRQIADLTLRGC